jgi:hypothetical protein
VRSDPDRLGDILAAVAKIEERIADSFDAFQRDEMPQVWVIHHLQIDPLTRHRRAASAKPRRIY